MNILILCIALNQCRIFFVVIDKLSGKSDIILLDINQIDYGLYLISNTRDLVGCDLKEITDHIKDSITVKNTVLIIFEIDLLEFDGVKIA